MIKNYFKTALRNLWRSKTFSLINILGLSIGLACCMLILLYSKDEISYDRFHEKKDDIYRITANMTRADGNIMKMGSTGMMEGPAFKQAIPEIETFMRLKNTSFSIKHGNEVFDQEALYVDSNFFSVFSFPLISGNPKTALTNVHSVAISEDVAKKYFGNKNAIGQVLELNTGKKFEPFIVSAVTKRSPQNSSIQIKMLVPMKFAQSQNDDTHWMNFFLNTFIVLKPGSNLKAVEAKFENVFNNQAAGELKEGKEKSGFKNKVQFGLQPLLQIHLSKDYYADNGLSNGSNPIFSYILISIALFILMIACVNFINLTIAHSLKRAKEIGIRKVIGGQRKQLIIQFLSESFILSFIAFLVAIFLVQLILPSFNTLFNKVLSFSYMLDIKLVAGYIILFILTALLAGFYPALVLSRFNPVHTLYGRFRLSGKNYLSKSLVVFQFTLATFFIISTVIIYSQFNYLMNFNLGYNDKNIVIVKPGEINIGKLDVFENELLKNSSVEEVSADQGGREGTVAHINNGKEIGFDIKHVDKNYFSVFQIPIVKGRNFSKDFGSDTSQSAIINESFAKAAGWQDPLGKQIDLFYRNKKYTVIGVIKDYHFLSLTEQINPEFFNISSEYNYKDVFIKIKPGNISQTLQYIEKTFENTFPLQPYLYSFKEAANEEQYQREAKWKQIIAFGAILTIFISCIGLFGLSLLSAEKRIKEIGIRKVLGASVNGIVSTLSKDFIKLVMVAVVISVPLAYLATGKWLQNYSYRITLSWWMFASAALLVIIIALLTISFQAMKAALANPVKSLRSE